MASAPAVQYVRSPQVDSYFSTPSPLTLSSIPPPVPNSFASSPSMSNPASVIAARAVPSEHAKLHKRSTIKEPSRRKNHVSEVTFNRASTLPQISDSTSVKTSHSPSQKGQSSNKRIKYNLRKFGTTSEEDTRDTIDLNKTAEENEELSGLAVTSASAAASPTAADTAYSRMRPHARSYSGNSQQSSVSGSFQPTSIFVHPMRQSPKTRPYTPPTASEAYSNYSTSVSGLDYASDSSRALGANAISTTGRSSRSSSNPHRPPLRVETSHPSGSFQESAESPYASGGGAQISASRSFRRRRRNTNPSVSSVVSGTPSTRRTSTDRAFAFVRGSARDSAPVNAETRTASIQAARQAFQEKEEAKARKFERKEQKKARKNSASGRSRSNTLEESLPIGLGLALPPAENDDEKWRHRQEANGARTESGSPKIGRTKMPKRFSTTAGQSKEASSTPDYSAGRTSMRSRFLQFWTWFRVRLLHMGLHPHHS